jgi:3-oxoadipate enol-lactonase
VHNGGYLISGELSGRPTLVLGHSLGTNFSLWDRVLGSLREHFCLVHYDPHPRPGTVSPTVATRGNELLALFNRFEIERADFCGISISGLLGQWLALEAPDRIRRLVLSNTAARIGNFDGWQQRITLIRQRGLPHVSAFLANRWFSPRFAEKHPEIVKKFATDLSASPTEEYLAACEILGDTDFRNRVAQIRTRTLIIAGSNDSATTVADADFLHQQIRSSQLLVFPCGHLACVEAPEAFASAVLEFLSEDH